MGEITHKVENWKIIALRYTGHKGCVGIELGGKWKLPNTGNGLIYMIYSNYHSNMFRSTLN